MQRQRWYPTAMVMSNGSILVVGGELGSNGAPEPSLEILPRPPGGDTWMFLDYLNRTDPNNLYPYLITLPSGRIFIGASSFFFFFCGSSRHAAYSPNVCAQGTTTRRVCSTR